MVAYLVCLVNALLCEIIKRRRANMPGFILVMRIKVDL